MVSENLDPLESQVKDFIDRISRIKQKLLLQEEEESRNLGMAEPPNSAISE